MVELSCFLGDMDLYFLTEKRKKLKSLSHVWLFETPWTVAYQAPPSVHGIFQARALECVAISSSRGSSRPRDRTRVSCILCSHFTIWATRETANQMHILIGPCNFPQCITKLDTVDVLAHEWTVTRRGHSMQLADVSVPARNLFMYACVRAKSLRLCLTLRPYGL